MDTTTTDNASTVVKAGTKVKPHVGNRRLLKLADYLEKLPPKRFNFAVVAKGDMLHDACGSVACAIGWMPKAFPRDMAWVCDAEVIDDPGLPYMYWAWEVAPKGEAHGHYDRDGGYGRQSFASAGRFFGLDNHDTEYLFNPSHTRGALGSDATPKQVAKHIRRFVAKRKKAVA